VLSIATLIQQAQGAAARGDWTAARQGFQQALALRPSDVGLMLQYSQAASQSGHYRQARESTLAAARASATNCDPMLALQVASRLRLFNEGQGLLDGLQRFLPVQRMPLPLLLGYAAQLSYLNLQERALELLDEAWRADPDYPPTLVSRAQVLIYLGRFDAARADLQQCLRRAPELGQAWWLLARLSSAVDAPGQIDALRRRLANTTASRRDVAFLQSALHQHLDRLGDHAAAWQAMQLANAAMREQVRHDPAQTQRLFDALLARQPRVDASAVPDASRVPIFIVGLHRSGTTLLEQLLEGHDDVQGMGELYDFTSQLRWASDHHCRGVLDQVVVERSARLDMGMVGSGYLRGLEWRLGKTRHFTDKLPSNLLNVGLICEALPQAKILRMVRDPVETCFSNLRELFSDVNPWSYDPLEMADYHHQSERLAAHWHQAYPGRMLDVDYGALTREPRAELVRVTDFCGLALQAPMLDIGSRTRAVATASAIQARGAVKALDTPKWAPYAQPLAPMIQRLQRPVGSP
jgi:tetratricopeptide (TPR) repeat protein